MNHLPKLSTGVTRTIGVGPARFDRGVAVAQAQFARFTGSPRSLRLRDDVGLDLDNGFDIEPPATTCTPCETDPTCPSGESRWCGSPGGIATKECCPVPPPVCGECVSERTCTRFDGTTFTQSCQPQVSGCCEVVR